MYCEQNKGYNKEKILWDINHIHSIKGNFLSPLFFN